MRNKAFKGAVCILSTFLILLGLFPIKVYSAEYTVDEVNSLIDGIIGYKLNSAGVSSVQEWIDGALTDNAGTLSEWYIMSLSQYGNYDLSAYESALSSYLSSHDESSATSREKYALALSAAGSTNGYMSDIIGSSIGQQGIMSYIYGLHVLNNGYTCPTYTAENVADKLVSMQFGDGGWALFGEYGDIDVTAMTMLALSPYYNTDPDVHSAVDRGIDFLSQRQQENGGYQSFGTPNPESASQVLAAVSALGIDCIHDDRFIKNGNTIIDGIVDYRLPDGSFCHIKGSDANDTATVQALYSLIAYKRMHEGRSSVFVFDKRRPVVSAEQKHDAATDVQPDVSEHNNAPTSSGTETVSSSSATTSTSSLAVHTSTTTVSGFAVKSTSSADALNIVTSSATTKAVTTTMYQTHSVPAPKNNSSFRTKAVIIIGASAVLLWIILFLLKKRSIKNYLFILVCAGAGIAVVFLSDIRSADEYYSGGHVHKENSIGTVTMEIRCDTIVGKAESDYIPDDGTILKVTEFEIEEGDTVFDILTEAARTYGIQMENKGSSGNAHGMVYISGINYIYEYDFGDLSGWVYHVNGITPSRNCGEYVLSDGDEIQWLYTCELGHDLNEVYENDGIFVS